MRESDTNENPDEPHIPATVIVLVYNTPDLLLQCLQGFYEACRIRGWQIIVVDNGSTKDVHSVIGGKFDGVEVIRSEQNLGFAAGNNLGLRRAKGEFSILMNSDVIAQAEILETLVELMKKEPQVGAMSPGLLTPHGEAQAFAFGSEASPCSLVRRGMRALLGLGPLHNWSIKEPIDVEWVSAACMCVRHRVIEEIGELDERFPLYFEDTDWCMRMRAAGWRVVYYPQLQVFHLGGASRPEGSADRKSLYYHSLVLFCAKHYGRGWGLLLGAFVGIYRILAVARSFVFGSSKKKDNC